MKKICFRKYLQRNLKVEEKIQLTQYDKVIGQNALVSLQKERDEPIDNVNIESSTGSESYQTVIDNEPKLLQTPTMKKSMTEYTVNYKHDEVANIATYSSDETDSDFEESNFVILERSKKFNAKCKLGQCNHDTEKNDISLISQFLTGLPGSVLTLKTPKKIISYPFRSFHGHPSSTSWFSFCITCPYAGFFPNCFINWFVK